MQRHIVFLVSFILLAFSAVAQPGGFGGRGPMGPPPGGGRPGGRSPMGEFQGFNNKADDSRASTVKKKKRVTDGSTFKVVGSLRDSITGEFLPYVNVSVLDSVDSTFVKGAATNGDGYFEVTDIPTGGFLLRVSAIGYQNVFIPFHVFNNTALGTIRLKQGATTLSEVVITAAKPLYAMDGEKTIYNVSEDPSIQTGTTNDALQNAPGVEVDVEGNITLRGVSSVEIWINDKPSKLTEENLKTYLETLPANALARIETITNPSAKYATDAEAVINIVTSAHIKSNHFISFGLFGSSQPSIGPWLSYMWANERLSINMHAGGRYNYNETNSYSSATSRKYKDDTTQEFDTTSMTTNDSESESTRASGNVGVHIDYAIDSMTDLNVHGMFNLGYNKSLSYTHEWYDQHFIADNPYTYNLYDTNDNKNISRFGMFGANILHKFDKNGHNLRVNFDGNLNGGHVDNYMTRIYDGVFDDEYKYYENKSSKQTYSLDARYNRPYSEQGEMSYGIGLSHTNTHNEYYRHYDILPNLYSINDTLRAYEFYGNDTRANADVNWTHRWGGFTLELGLGGRYDRIYFDYESATTGFSDDTTYNFFTINPSIHTSYRTESMHNFKLNYSLRMSNPGEAQLTTFKKYSENGYSTGNRNLKRAVTHSMEAGWTKFFESGSLGLEGYGRFSADEISNLTESSDEEDIYLQRIINYSMPYNMGSSYRIGGTIHATYRPTGFINVRLYSNIYDYGYRMERPNGTVLENSKLSYSIRLNVWAKVFNKYQFYVSGGYTSPTIGLASESKERYNINLGVRADFFNRKMSAFINIRDIFNWGKNIGTGSRNTNPLYITDVTSKTVNSRFISAGLTFRFGKMELERKAEGMESDTSISTSE